MNVQQFLTDQHVPFDVLHHPPSFTAQEMAQAMHRSGKAVAKTVLLKSDRDHKFMVAVLPASGHVDFAKVERAAGLRGVELASETEIGEHCPDCELGALPPFGSQYHMQTIVDQDVARDDDIVFEGNSHEESVRMRYEDFERIEHPMLASFAY